MTNSQSATYRDPFSATNQPAPERRKRTGSRAKLAQRFFEDTYAAWEEQGPSVLARAAFHDPVAFANMVARLMPQKIEVSTPTDGMSDERLAEMLEFAERMARLRAGEGATVIEGSAVTVADPLRLNGSNHENGLAQGFEAKGGGGPLSREGSGGINTSSALRPDRAESSETPTNMLDRSTSAPPIAETPTAGGTTVLPYPVGKPFATPDHEVERRNKAKLDPVDPASLF